MRAVEAELESWKKKVDEYSQTIAQLDKEKNLLADEVLRAHDRMKVAESQAKELKERDAVSQATIVNLSKQLEDTVNKLHALEKRFTRTTSEDDL